MTSAQLPISNRSLPATLLSVSFSLVAGNRLPFPWLSATPWPQHCISGPVSSKSCDFLLCCGYIQTMPSIKKSPAFHFSSIGTQMLPAPYGGFASLIQHVTICIVLLQYTSSSFPAQLVTRRLGLWVQFVLSLQFGLSRADFISQTAWALGRNCCLPRGLWWCFALLPGVDPNHHPKWQGLERSGSPTKTN